MNLEPYKTGIESAKGLGHEYIRIKVERLESLVSAYDDLVWRSGLKQREITKLHKAVERWKNRAKK